VHRVTWKAKQQMTTNAIDTPKNSIVLARTSRIIAFVTIRFTDTINPAAPAYHVKHSISTAADMSHFIAHN